MTIEDLLTIVVPVGGRVDLLARLFSSIITAERSSAIKPEVIVVSDGCSELEVLQIQRVVASREASILVKQQVRMGASAARQAGTALASGKYVWLVDSDDTVPSNSLRTIHAALAKHPEVELVAFGVRVLDERQLGSTRPDREIRPSRRTRILSNRQLLEAFLRGDVTGNLWNKVFLREILIDFEFPDIPKFNDFAATSQLIRRVTHAAVLPESLYHYRLRTGSISSDASRAQIECLQVVRALVEDSLSSARAVGGFRRDDIADYFFTKFIWVPTIKIGCAIAAPTDSTGVAYRAVATYRPSTRTGLRGLLLFAQCLTYSTFRRQRKRK